MAKINLTHLGDFSQGFSESISILKKLKRGMGSQSECAQSNLRGIFMLGDEKKTEKNALMNDRELPPNSYPFLNLS